jgi:hypothetical protein
VDSLKGGTWSESLYSRGRVSVFKIVGQIPEELATPRSACFVSPWIGDDLEWLGTHYGEEYRQVNILLEKGKCPVAKL